VTKIDLNKLEKYQEKKHDISSKIIMEQIFQRIERFVGILLSRKVITRHTNHLCESISLYNLLLKGNMIEK